jgi:hypothetical protein
MGIGIRTGNTTGTAGITRNIAVGLDHSIGRESGSATSRSVSNCSVFGIGNEVNPASTGNGGGIVGACLIGSNISATRANNSVIIGINANVTDVGGNAQNTVFIVNNGFAMKLLGNGAFVVPGSASKPGGGTWAATSDQRLKSNIVVANLARCADIVNKIDLKRFEWAPLVPGYDRTQLGFIAQEVETVFPKAVTRSQGYGLDDCASLDSWQMIMALFGAVKKLQNEVAELSAWKLEHEKTV